MTLRDAFVILVLLSAYSGPPTAQRRRAQSPEGVPNGRASLADEPYTVSYQAGTTDLAGNLLAGNVLMHLATVDGKLFGATGVDCDAPGNQPSPGAQILALDSSRGKWHLEQEFRKDPDGRAHFQRVNDLKAFTFRTDYRGAALSEPVSMLVATLFPFQKKEQADKDCYLYSRIVLNNGAADWVGMHPGPIRGCRAMGFFRDPTTGSDKIFVGAGFGTNYAGQGSIYSGGFDPEARGHIRWNLEPEFTGYKNRVSGFAELDGHFFFAAKPSVYARFSEESRSGLAPFWKDVYDYSGPTKTRVLDAGIRGLSPIPCMSGTGHCLLGVMEGEPGDILRFSLKATGLIATHEAEVDQIVRPFTMRYVIAGFNDIPTLSDPDSGETYSLIGLEHFTRIPGHLNSAWFLSRTPTQHYALHEVRPLPNPKSGAIPELRAVRTIIVSPFPEDQGRILFIGGYDCLVIMGRSIIPIHNTAWLYRVGLHTALALAVWKPQAFPNPTGRHTLRGRRAYN
jgi:hypothetical protein